MAFWDGVQESLGDVTTAFRHTFLGQYTEKEVDRIKEAMGEDVSLGEAVTITAEKATGIDKNTPLIIVGLVVLVLMVISK